MFGVIIKVGRERRFVKEIILVINQYLDDKWMMAVPR